PRRGDARGPHSPGDAAHGPEDDACRAERRSRERDPARLEEANVTRSITAIAIALLVLVLTVTLLSRWRAVNAVDNRTYVEMVAGVRDHGLPYHTSSIADAVPPSEFNIADHGKLWGEYPPLFPFLAAPALALGGLSFIYREVVLTL